MQYLDINTEYNIDKVKDLIKSLLNKNIITKTEADSVNLYKILEFTKTDIWKDLKQAKEIYREKPFYINIPIKDILKNDTLDLNSMEDENILVQGIIDLYYISKEDELILLDYKTDYVEKGKENGLIEKYKKQFINSAKELYQMAEFYFCQKQLEIYKNALEMSLEKNVNKVFIYSVYLGKSILVKF